MSEMTVEKAQALLDAFEAKPVLGALDDGTPWILVPAASGANADIHNHAPDIARAYIAQAAELTRFRAKVEAADKLAGTLQSVLDACDQGRMVETGAGGMTIEAQIRRSVYNGVPAWPIEEARAALTAYKEAGE